ncbi:MAG: MarR family transcriptional regulator [Planctomycetes bacterium]|nr:MarR family transcriptional regulator [Planctomycetota bacterium]
MKPDADNVQAAIGQKKPFRSAGQEGVIALLLAAEVVRRRFTQLVEARGQLTFQQYNVLRILRGAGDDGLPTLALGERMIEHTPGITRLLERLEEKHLVTRSRSGEDKRQVVCRITTRGRKLVDELDEPVGDLDEASLDCLSRSELSILIDFSNRIRRHGSRSHA